MVESRKRRGPRRNLFGRKLEEAGRIFEALRKESEAGVPIIVEGRRDEKALRELGVRGPVLCLKARGESRVRFLEGLDGLEHVILLTDFDREGGELELWLYQELSRRRVRADDRLWRRIRAMARVEVHGVEELPSFVRTVEARAKGDRQ